MAKSKEVTTESGGVQYRPDFASEEEYLELTDDWGGFCVLCGEFTTGVEPDARQYECEACEKKSVYGLDELMVREACYLDGSRWRGWGKTLRGQ